MAVAGLTINTERSKVVDFTYPFWFEPSAATMHVSDHNFFDMNQADQILFFLVLKSGTKFEC